MGFVLFMFRLPLSVFLKQHRKEVPDRAAPYAPVVASGEGPADHAEVLVREVFVVPGEGPEKLIVPIAR